MDRSVRFRSATPDDPYAVQRAAQEVSLEWAQRGMAQRLESLDRADDDAFWSDVELHQSLATAGSVPALTGVGLAASTTLGLAAMALVNSGLSHIAVVSAARIAGLLSRTTIKDALAAHLDLASTHVGDVTLERTLVVDGTERASVLLARMNADVVARVVLMQGDLAVRILDYETLRVMAVQDDDATLSDAVEATIDLG